VLTDDDRQTLRQLITQEETFRTMLTEARVYQDWERIRNDQRFSRALTEAKWDVIIRVLAPPPLEVAPSEFSETTRAPSEITDLGDDIPEPPPEPRIHRYRKRPDQPQLPPVYEYDTEGRPARPARSGPGSTRSHVTTRSSYGGDVRSIGEELVSFHHYQPPEDDPSSRPPTEDVRSTAEFSHSWDTAELPPSMVRQMYEQQGVLPPDAQLRYFQDEQQGVLPPDAQLRYFQDAEGGEPGASRSFYERREVSPGGTERYYRESHGEGGGATVRTAPSTIGDREEVYSMAETHVDWQRRQ